MGNVARGPNRDTKAIDDEDVFSVQTCKISCRRALAAALFFWRCWFRLGPPIRSCHRGCPARMRLMTQASMPHHGYIFSGPTLKVATRFPAVPRRRVFLPSAPPTVGVTPSAVEQFHRNAYAVAAQAVDPVHREYLSPARQPRSRRRIPAAPRRSRAHGTAALPAGRYGAS